MQEHQKLSFSVLLCKCIDLYVDTKAIDIKGVPNDDVIRLPVTSLGSTVFSFSTDSNIYLFILPQ